MRQTTCATELFGNGEDTTDVARDDSEAHEPADEDCVKPRALSRQEAHLLVACSDPDRTIALLEAHVRFFSDLAQLATKVRGPEVGQMLVVARASATGDKFAMGEVTVTRCVLRFEGRFGVGYVLGQSRKHAHTLALVDLTLQGPDRRTVEENVLRPLQRDRAAATASFSAKAATTRVNFETIAREAQVPQ